MFKGVKELLKELSLPDWLMMLIMTVVFSGGGDLFDNYYCKLFKPNTMKKKIQEVQNYFKSKLLKGEFELKSLNGRCAVLTVDEYSFCFTVMTDGKSICQHEIDTFMYLPFNKKEEYQLHRAILKKISPSILQEKKAKLEEFQKEYNSLLNQSKENQ